MKKATIQSLVSYLNGETVTNLDEIKAELEAELARGAEKAEANRQAYAEMHDPVMEAIRIAGAPVTAQDIASETGLSRSKISWALRDLWAEEVNTDRSGKVITYTLR